MADQKQKDDALKAVGQLSLLAAVLVYNAFAWGFVFFKFYGWFALPVFTNLPVINFYQAVGIFFFKVLFSKMDTSEKSIDGKRITSKLNYAHLLLSPWIILLITMFIKLFI